MVLFSPHKNKYFSTVSKIINNFMIKGPVTEKSLLAFLRKNGFYEADFEFEASLLNKVTQSMHNIDNANYHILKKDKNTYKPVIESKIPVRPTLIEKQWLKMILQDQKSQLFLKNITINKLVAALQPIPSPFEPKYWDIKNQDQYCDDFSDVVYQKNFKFLLEAVRQEKMIRYTYKDKQGKLYENKEAYPFRIEYSLRNDRFRLSSLPVNLERPIKMNLSRFLHIEVLEDEHSDVKNTTLKKLREKKVKQPLVLEIDNKYNAIERCFSLFSYYQKEACYHPTTDKHLLKIYYYQFDESEIIRDILSLGSSVIVIEPEHIRNQVIRRIHLQVSLSNDCL
ncbi:WYL domain-containing protein [Clostridiaceae bacterium 35-E11]